MEPVQLATDHELAISDEATLLRIAMEYERLADIYLKRFDEGRPLNFFHFDYPMRRLLRPAPISTQCGAGGSYVSITPDGTIFPCFEAVVESENAIGSVRTGFDRPARSRFQEIHADTRKGCRECWARYHCGGGCHAFNIRYSGDIHIPYRPYCYFTKLRLKIGAYLLAEIGSRGDTALQRLLKHLGISTGDAESALQSENVTTQLPDKELSEV